MLPYGSGMPPMGFNPNLIQASAYPAGVMHPPQLMPANNLALASQYGLPVQPWQGAGPTFNSPFCKYCLQSGHYSKMCPLRMAGLPSVNPQWVNFPSFTQPRPAYTGMSQPQPQMQMTAAHQLPPTASGPAATGFAANHLPTPATAPPANTAVGQVDAVCLSRAEYDKLMSINQEAVVLREKQAKLAAKNKRRRSARRQRQADSLLSSSETTSASDGTADVGPGTAAAAVDATAPARGAPAAPRNYATAAGAARGRSRSRARVVASEEDEEAADQQQQQQRAAATTALFGAPRRSGPDGRLDISRQLTALLQRQQSGSVTNCKGSLTTFLPASNPMERLKELWPVFCGNEPIPQRRADYVDILARKLSSHWQEITTYGA